MEQSLLDEAVQRQVQLEDIEARMAEASGQTADLFELARVKGEDLLLRLCRKKDVKQALVATRGEFQAEENELSYLEETDLVGDSVLAQRRQELVERYRGNPKFRLAERILGSITEPEQPTSKAVEDDERRKLTDAFLSRDPEMVANDMTGKRLVVGGKSAIIDQMVFQDGEYNKEWVATRPIFGPDRLDVYVANFRGNKIIYIRAGDADHTDCCVKVQAGTVDGTSYDKPSKLSSVLGFEVEQTGDLVVEGDTFHLVNLKDRKQPKPKR